MVVVNRHRAVVQEATQALPAPQAVIQRPGVGRVGSELAALQNHPLVPSIHDRLAAALAHPQPLLWAGLLEQPLHLIELADKLQRRRRQRAVVGRLQINLNTEAPQACMAGGGRIGAYSGDRDR